MSVGVGSSDGTSLVSGVGESVTIGIGLSEVVSLISGVGEGKIIAAVPWHTNKLTASQIEIISDFLADYAANAEGQAFTFEYSLYDDPDEQRQMFYLRASMDETIFAHSKQIPAPDLPENEVIGFVVADLVRQLELAAYHASIGELGILGEVPVEEEEE